ncbi:MAG TPA: hypothetical protein VGB18_03455, partial [Candidatus Thermoplasmatota archaeon]
SINITDATADPPHSLSSHWHFWVAVDTGGPMDSASGWFNITIERPPGPLPLAAPHRDFWGESKSIEIYSESGRLHEVLTLGADNPYTGEGLPSWAIEFPDDSIVPPSTSQLDLLFRYNSSSPPQLDFKPLLNWKGADRLDPEAEGMPPTTHEFSPAGGVIQWTIAVEERMWDSPYANRTAWLLLIDWTGQTEVVAPTYHDGTYTLTVQAARE